MNLKQLQKSIKKTREETAQELGINKKTLNNYIDGRSEPNIATLIKLADYYNVSLDELIGRTTITPKQPILTEEQKKIMQMIIALNRDNFGIAFGVVMGLYQKQMYQSN